MKLLYVLGFEKNMMNIRTPIRVNEIFLFFIFLIFLSCSKQSLVRLEPEDEFARAMEFFKNRKMDNAIKAFEQIIFYHAGSEYVDDAQFYMGCAYFVKKDYNQAIVEFDYLIKNFSNSPFLEEAHLYLAKAHLLKAPGYDKDETETKEAIALFDEFLTKFPNSKYTSEAQNYILKARSRLAKKEVENGKLYMKIKEFKSAEIYFKYVIENYPETASADEARYQLALIKERAGKLKEALELYRELLEKDRWQKKVEKKLRAIEKKL